MKINPKKLILHENNGIFSGDKNEPNQYAVYRDWSEKLIGRLRQLVCNHSFSSSMPDVLNDSVLRILIDVNPERATNALYHDMIQFGCSWEHLQLLRDLLGVEVAEENRGKFGRQVIEVMTAYGNICDFSLVGGGA